MNAPNNGRQLVPCSEDQHERNPPIQINHQGHDIYDDFDFRLVSVFST